MKNFVTRLLWFVIPIVVLALVPVSILVGSKENFWELKPVLTGKEKYLVGYTFNENNYKYLKWENLNLQDRNDVWAVGSSRVLQIREQMFDVSFYNAGYSVSSMNDFKPFLQSLPVEKYPKYLIVGLDQWMFNAAWDSLISKVTVMSWKNSFSKYPEQKVYKNVAIELLSGKYNLNVFNQSDSLNRIGLNARLNNSGFRNDGSFFYGGQIERLLREPPATNDFRFSDTFDRIEKGNRRFEYGQFINSKALLILDDFLKYCSQYNIIVVSFLPPFPDAVYERMKVSGHYEYMDSIFQKVKPIFDKYGYECYDFTTVSKCNSKDEETIDGFHGGEMVYQHMLLEMLRSNSKLLSITDSSRLKRDLGSASNRFILYTD